MKAMKAFSLAGLSTLSIILKKKKQNNLAMRMEIFTFRGGVGIPRIIKCESLMLISILTFRNVKASQNQPLVF